LPQRDRGFEWGEVEFFVSVASKGLSPSVSLLFAILAGRAISIAVKGLTGRTVWREANGRDGKIFEGVRKTYLAGDHGSQGTFLCQGYGGQVEESPT
jgi:hypothetical protein